MTLLLNLLAHKLTIQETDVDHNLMTPTAGSRIVQIPVKYFFSRQFDTLNQLHTIGRFEVHWKLVPGIEHSS